MQLGTALIANNIPAHRLQGLQGEVKFEQDPLLF